MTGQAIYIVHILQALNDRKSLAPEIQHPKTETVDKSPLAFSSPTVQDDLGKSQIPAPNSPSQPVVKQSEGEHAIANEANLSNARPVSPIRFAPKADNTEVESIVEEMKATEKVNAHPVSLSSIWALAQNCSLSALHCLTLMSQCKTLSRKDNDLLW